MLVGLEVAGKRAEPVVVSRSGAFFLTFMYVTAWILLGPYDSAVPVVTVIVLIVSYSCPYFFNTNKMRVMPRSFLESFRNSQHLNIWAPSVWLVPSNE